MSVSGLNHFAIRCTPGELPKLLEFYTKALLLAPGARPSLPAPGYWLYCNGRAVVHLYASLTEERLTPTGALDHISFTAQGLEETREHLRAAGVPYQEAPVPGLPLYQLFLRDPKGLKLELTFDLAQENERTAPR